MKLITYQSPNGKRVYICEKHKNVTTRDSTGQEHCQVHRGLTDLPDHTCHICTSQA